MSEATQFRSKDFYLSACILASGITLLRLEQDSPKVYFFVFNITPNRANEIIGKHWDRTLFLPTRNIIEAISELKTRLHNGY